LSSPPFQLNPDPAFYFDSRGHANAMAYLRFGVHQGEGFIVVTGDIGAGKTTLVKTLLASLNADQVVAAQIVSTQLEAGDLLRSIIAAFGIVPSGQSKAHLIATIEAFLTALATTGRRALLIVDEAQNLNQQAIEEMRMLSNFMLGSHALLQSFLVGQPDLRRMLGSPAMEQFRQRVIASCHLGPLEAPETRAYIEHRLRRVGWQHTPRFEDSAFNEIHRWSEGVPRRVNLLCNRLLLATYLGNGDDITRARVEQVAREMRREVGEAGPVTLPAPRPPEPLRRARTEPASGSDDGGHTGVVRRVRGELAPLKAPLLCIVDTPSAYLEAAALAHELAQHGELPQLVCIHPGRESDLALDEQLTRALPQPALCIHIGVAPARYAKQTALVQVRFDLIVEEFAPRAVLVLGNGDAVLACALVANKAGIALLRLDAEPGDGNRDAAQEINSVLLDRLADVLYVGKPLVHATQCRDGIAERIHSVGSLRGDVLRLLLSKAEPARDTLKRCGLASLHERGYALVSLQLAPEALARDDLAALVSTLCLLHSELPLVWSMQDETLAALQAAGLHSRLRDADIALLPSLNPLQMLGLVRGARCVIVGADAALHDEAQTLEMPSVCLLTQPKAAPAGDGVGAMAVTHDADHALRALRDALATSKKPGAEPPWDGGSATRIAAHLGSWLGRTAQSKATRLAVVAKRATPAPHREAAER
jgi:putative secretion ATPase (PEP-CTERM system associated)